MTIAAPPHPSEPTETGPDDVVEALIEEARQRARRRRRIRGAIAIAVVVVIAAGAATVRQPT